MSDEEPAPEAPSEESAGEAPPEVPAEDPPAQDPPAEDPPAQDPPAEDPPAQDPPAQDPPPEDPPPEDPPPEDPPAEDPPAEAPPAEDPPAEDPPAEAPPVEPAPEEPPKESPSQVAAEETQLGSPLPDSGDDEGLPQPAPKTQGVCGAGVNTDSNLVQSTTSVMNGKSGNPAEGEAKRQHELEVMRNLIYEDKGPRGFQLTSEYGPPDGLPPPAPMTGGVNEAGLNMSMSSLMEGQSDDPVAVEAQRQRELEIMRSLIYEDKEPRGYQLPSEYGPQGMEIPELGPQRTIRVPRNIAQQILDVIGGREAFPCNECDACAGTDCDEDGVMSFMGDLVLGLVEIVTEKLFQRNDGVSEGTHMDCGNGSVTNMVQKSMAGMAGALSQKVSQMSQKALPEAMELLSQKASQMSQKASQMSQKALPEVMGVLSQKASELSQSSMPEALEALNSMDAEASNPRRT